jgi:hypothetical protein
MNAEQILEKVEAARAAALAVKDNIYARTKTAEGIRQLDAIYAEMEAAYRRALADAFVAAERADPHLFLALAAAVTQLRAMHAESAKLPALMKQLSSLLDAVAAVAAELKKLHAKLA